MKLFNSDSYLPIIMSGVAFGILYSAMFAITNHYIVIYHGNFHDYLFNLRLFYTSTELYSSLGKLQVDLIHVYPYVTLIDFCVALSYGSFGMLLSRKILSAITSNKFILAVPYLYVAAAISNIVEDCLLGYLFYIYPSQIPMLVNIASFFTALKLMLLIFASFICFCVLFVYLSKRSTIS